MLPSCATVVQHADFLFGALAHFYADFTPWSPASHGDFTPIGAMARTSISEVLLHDASHSKRNSLAALTLGAIGVVYGDIGTSPLYAFREALAQAAQDGISRGEIIGVLSLALWALIIVVTMKYVLFLTRMDNGGEGGVLSLMVIAYAYSNFARHLNFVLFNLLNLVGSLLLIWSLTVHFNIASMALEIVWAVIALLGLAKAGRKT